MRISDWSSDVCSSDLVLLTVPSATFVLLGATGDLAHRMIFPSLYNLFGDNLLPEDFLIVASGRSPLDDAAFRKDIDKGLKEFLADGLYDSHQAAKFAEMIIYCPVSVDNDDQFAALADRVSDRMDKGFSIYLSTPPSLFAPTAMALKKTGLTGPHRRIELGRANV